MDEATKEACSTPKAERSDEQRRLQMRSQAASKTLQDAVDRSDYAEPTVNGEDYED